MAGNWTPKLPTFFTLTEAESPLGKRYTVQGPNGELRATFATRGGAILEARRLNGAYALGLARAPGDQPDSDPPIPNSATPQGA